MSNDLCTCPPVEIMIREGEIPQPQFDPKCPQHGKSKMPGWLSPESEKRLFGEPPKGVDLQEALDLLESLVEPTLNTVVRSRVLTWIKMMRGLNP